MNSKLLASVIRLLLIATSASQPAPAQSSNGTEPQVSFHFERPGVAVPRYTFTVLSSGATSYEGEEADAPSAHSAGSTTDPPQGRPFKIATRISPATTKRIFATAKSLKDFNIQCESHARNIADTGKKTLSFTGPEGHAECTYNYSENKNVAQLTDTFLAIAETMDEGRQLEHFHRFDRLGLDAAITALAEQVNSGRALELGTIADTLRSIAADTSLIQRVRLRASQLLSLLPAEMQQSH